MTNKDPLHSTGNSAQCYVAAGMGGEFGGKWIHAHVWLRVPESITTLLTGYMSIQNKKLKKKKEEALGMWQSGQSSTTASSLPSCEVLGDLLNLSETQFSGTRLDIPMG